MLIATPSDEDALALSGFSLTGNIVATHTHPDHHALQQSTADVALITTLERLTPNADPGTRRREYYDPNLRTVILRIPDSD